MADLKKLATYLDSFKKDDPGYDAACYIKSKLAADLADPNTINNGHEDNLMDTDVTMSTPEQQTKSNHEGDMMSPAFREFDVLNKLKDQKNEIKTNSNRQDQRVSLDTATEQDFGTNAANAKQASLYTLLVAKLRR
jgi:hypothetical protein